MRKIAGLLFAVLFFFPSISRSEDFGVQIDVAVGFNIPIESDFSVPILAECFYDNSSGNIISFIMAGVHLDVNEWYQTTNSIGVAGNFPTDRTSYMVSSAHRFRFWEGNLVLFANLHMFVASDSLTYFGVYSADWARYNWINLGFRAEQVNDTVAFGPRVGLTVGPYHFEIQYHVGVQEENRGQTLRFLYYLVF